MLLHIRQCKMCETAASYLNVICTEASTSQIKPTRLFLPCFEIALLMIRCNFCSSPQRILEIRRRKPFASNVKTLTTSKFLRLRVLWRDTLVFTYPCTDSVDLSVRLGSDCHQSCPDRTYSVDDTMVCAPCEDKNCVICDPTQCYFCEEGFYVFGNNWTIYDFFAWREYQLINICEEDKTGFWRCTQRSWHQE